jgi:hypothetical protein
VVHLLTGGSLPDRYEPRSPAQRRAVALAAGLLLTSPAHLSR